MCLMELSDSRDSDSQGPCLYYLARVMELSTKEPEFQLDYDCAAKTLQEKLKS